MGQQPVDPVRARRLLVLVEERLVYHLLNVGIFALNNFLFITAVHYIDHGDRVLFPHLLVVLQKLDGMPAHGGMCGIMGLHDYLQLLYLLLDPGRIVQNIFLHSLLIVMDYGVEQDIQSRPSRRGDGHRRHIAQHFGKPVHIDLHSPLLHDIHHVQGKHHRLPQLQKLQRQVKIPLQRGGIHHIDDHVDVIVHGALPGHLLLYGVTGEGINAGGVNQCDFHIFIARLPLKTFHRDPRPVCNLQPGTRQRVKKSGLSTVWVADTGNIDMLLFFRMPHSVPFCPQSAGNLQFIFSGG